MGMTGFYDLCVPYNKNLNELKETLNELSKLRYRTVAIEQIFDNSEVNKKEKARYGADIFPLPIPISFIEVSQEFKDKLKILRRLTIVFHDTALIHSIATSANLKKFNILAVSPKTESLWQHCCSSFNGSIICHSTDNKYMMNRKHYNVAVRRGLYFEIRYSPIISDSVERKKIISQAHIYHSIGKSKNIIITSGAMNKFQVRGPYDISNLGLIFGLSEEQSKNSILNVCRELLINAEHRRQGGKVFLEISQTGLLESSADEESGSESDEDMDIEHPTKRQKCN